MSSPPVDWLLDASALEKKLPTLSLPMRRVAMIDALQELAQESSRMACFLGKPTDKEISLDYRIVEEEMIKGMQRFQGTLQKVLHWQDYDNVKQEPLSPWFGSVSSTVSSRDSTPLSSSEASDRHFDLYAPDSPKSDAYTLEERVHASMTENLVDDLQEPLVKALEAPLVETLIPALVPVLGAVLAQYEPLVQALAEQLRPLLPSECPGCSLDARTLPTAIRSPSPSRNQAKRTGSPGLAAEVVKKACLSPLPSE